MNSFYGGKKGFSFIFQPNSLNDGIWEDLGTENDEDNINTLYSGIKRKDLKYGEYAIVTHENELFLYRIIFNENSILIPSLISIIPIPKGEEGDGYLGQWLQGNYLTHDEGIETVIIPDSRKDDMYMNTRGNIYKNLGNDRWEYIDNIRGPQGDPGNSFIITSTAAGGNTSQQFFKIENTGIITSNEILTNTIEIVAPTGITAINAITDCNNTPLGYATYAYKMFDFNDEQNQLLPLCQKYPNNLQIYLGGLLPPLMLIPDTGGRGVSVFRRKLIENNNIVEETYEKLPSGIYLILSDGGLIKYSDPIQYARAIMLAWNISSGESLSQLRLYTMYFPATLQGNNITYGTGQYNNNYPWGSSAPYGNPVYYYPPNEGATNIPIVDEANGSSGVSGKYSDYYAVMKDMLRHAPATLRIVEGD